MKNVFLNFNCSTFQPARTGPNGEMIFASKPSGFAGCLQYLNSAKNKPLIEQLRKAKSPEERAKLKTALPFATPSMLISGNGRRRKNSNYEHTGFICLDIDRKHNEHISNFGNLKAEFANVSNVAAALTSAGGNGYFLLIPIAQPEKHKEHFLALEKFFKSHGITIDPACKDITRPRFCTYDPEPWLNEKAETLTWYENEPKRKPRSRTSINGESVFDRYNLDDHFLGVLESHGWELFKDEGDKILYTRPGKDKSAGPSAEYDYSKGVFFVFSSNAEPFEGGKGYNPSQVFATLEHGGDMAKAAKALEVLRDFSTIEI